MPATRPVRRRRRCASALPCWPENGRSDIPSAGGGKAYNDAMIQVSQSAQGHFLKLIEREGLPGLGVRLSAVQAGTAGADVRLEFAQPGDLHGDEWVVDCDGFTIWLEAASASYLEGAEIDYETRATGGQLQIRAPKIKGVAPEDSAPVAERVRWLVEHEINPQLAQHGGHVTVEDVTAQGVVVLRFGGGCHGCGMADVTLKQGIEKTLLEKVAGVTGVRDATDHDTGDAPYMPRENSRGAPVDPTR